MPTLKFKSAQEIELEQKQLELEQIKAELEEARKLQEEQRQKQEQELQELRKLQEEQLMQQQQQQQEKLQQQQQELEEQRKQFDIERKEQLKELRAARQVQEDQFREKDRQMKEQQKSLTELEASMQKEARDLQKRQVEMRQMRVIYGSQGQGGQGGSASSYTGKGQEPGGQGGSASSYTGKGKEPVDRSRGKGKQATATYTEKQIHKLVVKFVDGANAEMEAKEKAKADAKANKASEKATSDKKSKSKKHALDSEWRYTPPGQKKRDDDRASTRKKNLTVGRDCVLTKEIFDPMSDDEKAAQIVFWDGTWEELEDDLQNMTIVKDELKDPEHEYREYYNKAFTAWTNTRFEHDKFSAVYNYVNYGKQALDLGQGVWLDEYVSCKKKGQQVIKDLDAEFPGMELPSGEYKTAPPMPVAAQPAGAGEELADDVGGVDAGEGEN
jgi:myosin heavy subunit